MPDRTASDLPDEAYHDEERPSRSFDAALLEETAAVLPMRRPILASPTDSVTDAVRAMHGERFGCVVVTGDGTRRARVRGIFTERDVLFRVVDRGRNPARLPLDGVMTRSPETITLDATIAWVLHLMSIEGYQHLPVVDGRGHPVHLLSARDVIAFLVQLFPRRVLNLPPRGAPEPRKREGA